MNFNLGEVLLQYACLLFSLCVHEAAHAIMADRCGDPSARLLGRATLNPLAHIDPLGTVIMPLVMMTFHVPFLFGWAKPVPFNPRNLHDMRRDTVFIGLAGPISNFLLVIASAFVLRIILLLSGVFPDVDSLHLVVQIPIMLIMINLVLMLFNLIPLPPLDGHHVLEYFLPPAGQRMLQQIGPMGIIIAIVVAQPILRIWLPRLFNVVIFLATWGHSIS